MRVVEQNVTALQIATNPAIKYAFYWFIFSYISQVLRTMVRSWPIQVSLKHKLYKTYMNENDTTPRTSNVKRRYQTSVTMKNLLKTNKCTLFVDVILLYRDHQFIRVTKEYGTYQKYETIFDDLKVGHGMFITHSLYAPRARNFYLNTPCRRREKLTETKV
jgi:hypothetical protein